jgi:DNA-binding CsgD family transcriptional regulator
MRTRVLTETKRTTLERPPGGSSRPRLVKQGQVIRSQSMGVSEGVGFLLADVNLNPLYANGAAVLILGYGGAGAALQGAEFLQERIRFILRAERFALECSTTTFPSGRRRYVCRPFLLESRQNHARPPMVALVLERCPREGLDFSEASRRYHLSRRERETVQHLSHGLTTKEAAEVMNVSPNTVKQFVRLIMTKMGVTTRSGIIGKLLGG